MGATDYRYHPDYPLLRVWPNGDLLNTLNGHSYPFYTATTNQVAFRDEDYCLVRTQRSRLVWETFVGPIPEGRRLKRIPGTDANDFRVTAFSLFYTTPPVERKEGEETASAPVSEEEKGYDMNISTPWEDPKLVRHESGLWFRKEDDA